MLKRISILSVTSIILLSGCASKPEAIVTNSSSKHPQATIKIANGAGAPSWSHNESKAFHNVLEAAAAVTLQRGYKYFAILKPDEISNIKGSLKNTAKELIAQCDPSSTLFISIPGAGGLHKCGTYNTNATMKIAMYNEEQVNFTVIDAQAVLDYLKKHDLYDDNGVDIKVEK